MTVRQEVEQYLSQALLPVCKRDICKAWDVPDWWLTDNLAADGVRWQVLVDNERVARYQTLPEALMLADKAKRLGFTTKYGRQAFCTWRRRMVDQGKLPESER